MVLLKVGEARKMGANHFAPISAYLALNCLKKLTCY